jgi:PPOX class probable F420-dependent enzyme
VTSLRTLLVQTPGTKKGRAVSSEALADANSTVPGGWTRNGEATTGVRVGMRDDALRKLLRSQHLGVLATLMPDGRPHLSTITYAVDDAATTLRISLTASRVKTRNLRLDPRAALHVLGDSPWSWVTAEGTAELSPVAAGPHDDTVEELISYYRAISGEHPDWDDYRRAMVADERLVLRLKVDRLYGQTG